MYLIIQVTLQFSDAIVFFLYIYEGNIKLFCLAFYFSR